MKDVTEKKQQNYHRVVHDFKEQKNENELFI